MSRRRLDVTPTQAVASMLATLTAAIAASSLGIAGTIIGAAVMSLASTMGAAIYKHYLARGHDGLRAAVSGNGIAAAVLGQHQSLDPDETARLRPDGEADVESQDGADAQPAERRPTAGQRAAEADSAGARVRTALAGRAGPAGPARPGQAGLGYTAAEHPVAGPDADGSTSAHLRPAAGQGDTACLGDAPGLGGAARLRVIDSQADAGLGNADRATGPGTADGLDGAAGGRGKPTSGRHGTRSGAHRWLVLAGAMVGAFVVAMGAVTAVEAIAGKPLETLIWHRAGSGTTIGSVVGHPAQHRPTIVPGNSPASSQSPSAPPSSTSPGLVSPTPTPSESVIPSSGTSVQPGPGTQAQDTTPAPSQ